MFFWFLFAVVDALSCTPPSITPGDFSAIDFDYVIIGSGAGGLPVASRLSEDSSLKIGLIEAGTIHLNDPLVDVPGYQGRTTGNGTYDWLFATIPQPNGANRVIQETRGKMFGGSTGVNLLGWDRGSKIEYDAWPTLSQGRDWDFDSLLPYLKKSETVNYDFLTTYPGVSPAQWAAAKASFKVADGSAGPIGVSYNSVYDDTVQPFVQTWNNLKVRTNPNPGYGITAGVRNERRAVGDGIRSYAANAYYCPISNRPNLFVLTGAHATRILISSNRTSSGLHATTGVEFISSGQTFTAKATREVILSAGAVQTPQLLELSGIGDKRLLSTLGISTTVDLPGVGENLMDHIYVVSQFSTLPNITTFDKLRYNATFLAEQTALFNQNKTGFLTGGDNLLVFVNSNDSVFPSQARGNLITQLRGALSSSNVTALQRAQLKIQLQWLQDGTVPQAEFITAPQGLIVTPTDNNNYITLITGLMHPASRGSIHINSTDPLAAPVIDPKYLSFLHDLTSLRTSHQISNAVTAQEPIANLLTGRVFPPSSVASDADVDDFVQNSFTTGCHLSGTAPMASRDLGGVVDQNLRVYGMSNLRIADASIIPIIPGAHLQATVYAIGEKAADIIRSGRK